MPSIHLRGCSYTHSSASPVLVDIDLDIDHDPVAHGAGWVGLVGANGAGKSTLLRIIAGRLTPTSGRCDVHSDRPPLLVEQEVDRLPEAVRTFAWDWGGDAARLRRQLLLDPDDVHDALGRGWHALSPGLQTRWRIAAALHAKPDVLLLDEPTNHLDGDGRAVLVAALRAHRGLGVLVSHDRALLDELTGRTVRVHDGTAEVHAGSYTAAAHRWRQAEQTAADALERATRSARRDRRQLADLRRARHGAEASAARQRRTAAPGDSDAREVGRKIAAARSEAAIARRVRAQRSRLERTEVALASHDTTRDHRGGVAFRHDLGRGQLLRVRGDVPHAGGQVQLRDVDVAIQDGERVRVAGGNGAGKTSLLTAMLAVAPPDGVARLDQEVEPGLDWLDRLDPRQRGRVLGTAARLGVVPDRVLDARATSPGERRKLALARILASDTRLLVLDEPTNHLDLPAIDALHAALHAWPGALVLVTHDATLADVCTTTWTVADGAVSSTTTGDAQ